MISRALRIFATLAWFAQLVLTCVALIFFANPHDPLKILIGTLLSWGAAFALISRASRLGPLARASSLLSLFAPSLSCVSLLLRGFTGADTFLWAHLLIGLAWALGAAHLLHGATLGEERQRLSSLIVWARERGEMGLEARHALIAALEQRQDVLLFEGIAAALPMSTLVRCVSELPGGLRMLLDLPSPGQSSAMSFVDQLLQVWERHHRDPAELVEAVARLEPRARSLLSRALVSHLQRRG